ncbi:MAG: urea ABC transporter permease subunit UrtC, partial [Pseudomonadota bacterium]
AILVNGAKTLLTGWVPEIWIFVLGAMFVLVTLFLPKGVLGGLDILGRKVGDSPTKRAREAAHPAE